MNQDKAVVFSQLCRLCLKETGDSDLFDKQDLVQDIYLCTGVKVTRSNNLPRKICVQCLKIVINAKELRLMIEENEMHMKILFDHEESVTQNVDELSNEKVTSVSTTDSTSSIEDKDTTDDEENNTEGRKRLKSIYKSESPNKIAVRKDLFASPNKNSLDSISCTYVEGAKYGISKISTIDDTNDMKVSYTCSMCPKTFSSWRKVYCHQRNHNKSIECPEHKCKKKFATKGDLQKHMRTHTGERPYTCDVCDKSFAQRGTLKAHKESVHMIATESLVLYVKDES